MGFMRLWGLSKSARKQHAIETSSKPIHTTQAPQNIKEPLNASGSKPRSPFFQQMKANPAAPTVSAEGAVAIQRASSQQTLHSTIEWLSVISKDAGRSSSVRGSCPITPSPASSSSSRSNTPESETTSTDKNTELSPRVHRLRSVRSAYALRLSMDGQDDCDLSRFTALTTRSRRSSVHNAASPDKMNRHEVDLDLALTKFQLRSATLGNLNGVPSPLHTTSLSSSSNGNWGLDRHDSGIDLADASEAQRWKRAYHVQREAHDMVLQRLAKQHETDLDLLKENNTQHLRGMSFMMRTSAESNRAVANGRIEELNKAHEEEIADLKKEHESEIAGKDQLLTDILSRFQGLNAKHEELMKNSSDERLEDEYKALKVELQNTRHRNDIYAREVAELQGAWQRKIDGNWERANVEERLRTAEAKAADFKNLWEKECSKNWQLRCEQETLPGTRHADMEQQIEYLKEELMKSEMENNKHLAAFNQREEEHTKLKYIHAAEVAAVCGQTKLYKSNLLASRKETHNLRTKTITLLEDLSNTLNSDEVSEALNRYCDIVSNDETLESSLEEYAKLLDEAYKSTSSLEMKNSALQRELSSRRLELDKMELQRNQYMIKVQDLEFREDNAAEFHEKDLEAKDAQIQEFRSQMSIIEDKLRSGLDAFSRHLFERKDDALERAHQRIQSLEHDLNVRGFFYGLDECERDQYISELESLPDQLHEAQMQIKRLREMLGLEGESG
ncbi:MAG: hypothetical protein Q9191_001846 [Dirinaria sp. TL-2023a]